MTQASFSHTSLRISQANMKSEFSGKQRESKMQSMKETAANVAASAKSGMEKTKAVVQEKMERMTANNPTEKQMATEKKEEKINQAEHQKQEVREKNAASSQSANGGATQSYSTTGETGQSTGSHQMSALPGHGSGQPMGQVTEGIIKSQPIGTATRTGRGRPTTAHNIHTGYGTGDAYSG